MGLKHLSPVILALVFACPVQAEPPEATVTFIKGYRESLRPVRTQEYLFVTRRCNGTRIGSMEAAAFVLPGRSRSRRVPTGERLYIYGNMHFSQAVDMKPAPGGVSLLVEHRDCSGFALFVPQAGHAYTVKQEWVEGRCTVLVADDATGRPPPDIADSPPPPTVDECAAEKAASAD